MLTPSTKRDYNRDVADIIGDTELETKRLNVWCFILEVWQRKWRLAFSRIGIKRENRSNSLLPLITRFS